MLLNQRFHSFFMLLDTFRNYFLATDWSLKDFEMTIIVTGGYIISIICTAFLLSFT